MFQFTSDTGNTDTLKRHESQSEISFERKINTNSFIDKYHFLITLVIALIIFTLQVFSLKKNSSYLLFFIAPILIFYLYQNIYLVVLDLKSIFIDKKKLDYTAHIDLNKSYPPIAFIIPSYQEPFEVAKLTFNSIVNLKYNGKKEIIVVDNSKDTKSSDFNNWKFFIEEFNSSNPEINVHAKFIYNENGSTLKPGNLDLAQKHIILSDYVVFVDVDSTLPSNKHILEKSIEEFQRDRFLGFIQFKLIATNNNFNSLSGLIAASQNLLRYRNNLRGYGGFTVFSGHNGIWRKNVLDRIGPWLEYYRNSVIVTEDILKSLNAYSKGYYGKSMSIETGEWVPNSLDALEKMWTRWTYGTCQVFCKHYNNWDFWKKMKSSERFDFMHFISSYIIDGTSLIFVILSLFIIPINYTNGMMLLLLYLGPLTGSLALYLRYSEYNKRHVRNFISTFLGNFIVYAFINVTVLKATLNFILKKHQGWISTPKSYEKSDKWLSVIAKRRFHILYSIIMISLCFLSWKFKYSAKHEYLVYYTPVLLNIFIVLSSIVFFSKSGRKEHNIAENAQIDRIIK